MLIHPTPIQDETVENSQQLSVRATYKDYEASFVILHPFLKIKSGEEKKFKVENYPDDWPSKKEIINSTEKITWAQIIKEAGLKDISELDRQLAYWHCRRRAAEKTGWIKLNKIIDNDSFVAAQVDNLPEILINPIFEAIQALGYTNIIERNIGGEMRINHPIKNLISSKNHEIFSHAKLETPDKRILIITMFDESFSYLSSSEKIINKIVSEADLEGFFCNNTTRADWSFILEAENIIDWSSPERKSWPSEIK